MLVVVATGFVVGFERFPYTVLAPGSATAGEPLVKITGHPSYHHRGALLFVTVNVRDRVSGAEAVYGWLRGDQAVFPSNDVVGTHTPEEDFRTGVLEMRVSKQAAVVLAMRHLGLHVGETDRGALVTDIVHGSPADGHIGIGDTIVGIDGRTVTTSDALRLLLAAHHPGDTVHLAVRRFRQSTAVAVPLGTAQDVTVKLASFPADGGQPAQPNRAFLGITPVTDAAFTLPFPVDIDTGPVGGPSAGLAFTLTLIDRLSPAGILHGHKVAATGTIDLEGRVGPVGGVPQKTIAVRRSGADIFLVPSAEYAQARAEAGSMRVVKVDTLDQALKIIEQLGG
ncbi:MAG TPA: PDZ domain-containing protein [Acidimicrobiales bacterium]|jgi:PDZ domain-containing protein|nr:PDZ domain-containing protein [Acidimicrobiales bacterium]